MTKGRAKGKGAAKPVSGYMKAATAGVGLVGAAALGRSAYNQYRDKHGYYSQGAIDKRAGRYLRNAEFEAEERVHAERLAVELAARDRRIAAAQERADAARAEAAVFAAQAAAAQARMRGLDAITRAGNHARRAHQVASPQGGVFNLRRQHSPTSISEMIDQRLAEL